MLISKKGSVIVVGCGGLVGGGLLSELSCANYAFGTSRNVENNSDIYLDLEYGNFEAILDYSPSIVYICSALTSFLECENNPEGSYLINVTNTFKLIRELVNRGAFVVWLSSNAVFDGQSVNMDEFTQYSPTTSYGHQKMSTELAIIEDFLCRQNVAIVRLSKVVSRKSGVFVEFLNHLQNGDSFQAFNDLYLCPVSHGYVCKGLIHIANKGIPGIYHLSGERNLSYYDFAKLIAKRSGASTEGIISVESCSRTDISILYKPRYANLQMNRTTRLTGLKPELIDATLNEII